MITNIKSMDNMLDGWNEEEEAVARYAFERAYNRAIEALVASVRQKAEGLDSVESLWQLHDFLSIQRHVVEGRFDFRLEGILFVFASLVKEDFLQLEELQGLDADKLSKISAMAKF
ncbi:MAG: hypothetical protein WCK64_07780 [Synechococcaceae cyanobacterium ELA445]|jgi:hypothetical protein